MEALHALKNETQRHLAKTVMDCVNILFCFLLLRYV